MIMHTTPLHQASSLQTLLLRQNSQQPKNNRHPTIQLHPHQPVAHRIRNVLKVHRRALDQHADGDDRVEGSFWLRGGGGLLLQVNGGAGEEVGRAYAFARVAGLDLGGGVEAGPGWVGLVGTWRF